MILKTALHSWHVQRGARMTPFAGWDMPVIYSSIIEEHHATRQGAGLFDISHMGRVVFSGPGALPFLEKVTTNRLDNLQPGQVRYGLVLNESAGMLDDILVYRRPSDYLMVVNASNREKLLSWFRDRVAGFDATMTDETLAWSMIACQGPKAVELAQPLFPADSSGLRYYYSLETTYEGAPAIVSRTGYTGEDGVEVIVPSDKVVGLWERLISAGAMPAGLGARDTLRLEAAMPLYGHELNESYDPIQAGLAWAVKADVKDFVGKSALARRTPGRPVRVGLRLSDKRIAREGFDIHHAGAKVGVVTSGTFGPTLQASIAMGYVDPVLADPGVVVDVIIREKPVAAQIVTLPFYRRERTNHG